MLESADMDDLGSRLRGLRQQRNLSGRALATYLGISNAHVSDMENGKTNPSSSLIVRLAEYFNCSADYLLGLTDDPSPAGQSSEIQQLYNRLSAARQADLLGMAENWLMDESEDFEMEWIRERLEKYGDRGALEVFNQLLDDEYADLESDSGA